MSRSTLTLSFLELKRLIRRMLDRMGSAESSSMLWVVTGGRLCLCVDIGHMMDTIR